MKFKTSAPARHYPIAPGGLDNRLQSVNLLQVGVGIHGTKGAEPAEIQDRSLLMNTLLPRTPRQGTVLTRNQHRKEAASASPSYETTSTADVSAEVKILQERLRHLTRVSLLAQEHERKRISRDLHDIVAQTLSGISFQLALIKKKVEAGACGLGSELMETEQYVRQSMQIVHQFARELRPPALDDLGLSAALNSLLDSFSERAGSQAERRFSGDFDQLDEAQQIVIFRVTQEALVNIERHAQATRIRVKLQVFCRKVVLTIRDNGKGFDVNQLAMDEGSQRLGLIGMREHLEMVEGGIQIKSTRGKGTLIKAQIPRSNFFKES